MVSFGNLKVYKNGSAVSQVQRENDHPKIKSNSEEKTTIRSKKANVLKNWVVDKVEFDANWLRLGDIRITNTCCLTYKRITS